MATAPKGSAYIGPSRLWVWVEGKSKRLTASVARPDLVLIGADELLDDLGTYRGLEFGGVVVDHAARVGRYHKAGLDELRLWVCSPPDTGIPADGIEAA